MPLELNRDRVVVVLVRARNPQNIGAVARAMHDFGFSDLRIVNDFVTPLEGARSAVDASSVLNAATSHASLAGAIADCTLVVGTTAVGERDLQHPIFALNEGAPAIRVEIAGSSDAESCTRVALLFGSEKTGLSNEELSHCHWLLTIPMHQPAGTTDTPTRHLSMNLGQAVAVCLYELVQDRSLAPLASLPTGATAADLERLVNLLGEVLEASEYIRHHPAHSGMADIRRLVMRLRLNQTDVSVWMGILRQVLWKMHL